MNTQQWSMSSYRCYRSVQLGDHLTLLSEQFKQFLTKNFLIKSDATPIGLGFAKMTCLFRYAHFIQFLYRGFTKPLEAHSVMEFHEVPRVPRDFAKPLYRRDFIQGLRGSDRFWFCTSFFFLKQEYNAVFETSGDAERVNINSTAIQKQFKPTSSQESTLHKQCRKKNFSIVKYQSKGVNCKKRKSILGIHVVVGIPFCLQHSKYCMSHCTELTSEQWSLLIHLRFNVFYPSHRLGVRQVVNCTN